MKRLAFYLVPAALVLAVPGAVHAQSTLDRVIQAKSLRCGVVLDSPPSGFRDADNQPDGFDVTYCRDMAAALGAEPVIVETPSPDRIPALVSDRVDVLIASTANTPQRAISVAFSQPYMNYLTVVVTRKDTGISTFDDIKGKKLGGVTGSTTEQELKKFIDKWADPATTYTGYASDTEAFLALSQGKIDMFLQAQAVFNTLQQSGQFPDFVSAGPAPVAPDIVAMAVKRGDQEFLNWVKLFVWNQVTSGRFQEVYTKYLGEGPLPSLVTAGVDY